MKSQKYYKSKTKIIASVSSTFLRTTLQKILEFINDKKEASLIFTDLAHTEAKFLENFLGIYKRRKVFEMMMSPDCNNIFNEIHKCFNQFYKTCKLDVDAMKTNVKTKKREVTFLKVPRYVPPTMTSTIWTQVVNENSSTTDKTDVNPKCLFLNTLFINEHLSNIINTLQTNIHSPSNDRTENNTVQNESIQNNHTKNIQDIVNDNCEDKTITEDDGKKSKPPKKCSPNISKVNTDTEAERVAKDTSKILKDPKKNIPPKKSIIFEKSTQSKTNAAVGEQEMNSQIEKKVRERKKDSDSRKDKLLEAMSTPLESEIGLRMMQVMGWQGGALGIRGVGITEPIIPMLHLTRGAGLGHVTEESKEKEAEFDFRIDMLETILDLLDNEMNDTKINYVNEISEKDKCFLKMVLTTFNNRNRLSVRKGVESELGKNIQDKMMEECNLCLGMKISSNNKNITLKKIFKKKTAKNKIKLKNKNNIKESTTNTNDNNLHSYITKLPENKKDFEGLIVSKILELLKSEEQCIKIDFDGVLVSQYRSCMENLCSNINRKQKYAISCFKVFLNEIYEKLGNNCLKVEYDTKHMSIILKKIIDQNHFTNSATNNLNINANSEGNDDKVTDVKNDATFTNKNNDNETLVTKDDLDVNDEIDKGNGNGVWNHKSNKNNDNKYYSYNYCYELNENSLNIESGDNTNSQQLDLIDRNTDMSVCTNNCEILDKVSDEMKADKIDNKELKIVECDDAINNKNSLERKLLQTKTDPNNKKESTEYNNDRTVGFNTVENIDKTDRVIAKETKPSKEILSNEFDIECERKNCDVNAEEDITDEMNTSDVYSISDKSVINTEKLTVFVNSDNRPQRIKLVIIEKVTDLCSKLFLKEIQNLISNNISENFIPQLKCHGVEIRGIIYSCYNEETFQWLKEVLSNYKIRDYKQTTDNMFTVQIKIKTMLDVKKVLTLLELCNVGLCCGKWVVLEGKNGDFSVFSVNIDGDSLNYICDNNFKLSIGVDEAQFSILCSF
ncbi:probable serine/threonine-protein kinase ndrD isoform X2 [Nymphalis io]|uniref:probable serine/threonine-protein kinase ndrD isoform X2 n=2 Tax=Inachis io TaxID=171585 RepID=UPI002168EB75|nr:probable serine/threonine-protein kinase ndrD isoform X2 [Nymphalis io]XP_050359014.1 probable serine/threonine-protein kinase ndrD isoform X2 [Nymphalis io]